MGLTRLLVSSRDRTNIVGRSRRDDVSAMKRLPWSNIGKRHLDGQHRKDQSRVDVHRACQHCLLGDAVYPLGVEG